MLAEGREPSGFAAPDGLRAVDLISRYALASGSLPLTGC
jgi:hypothetical protein